MKLFNWISGAALVAAVLWFRKRAAKLPDSVQDSAPDGLQDRVPDSVREGNQEAAPSAPTALNRTPLPQAAQDGDQDHVLDAWSESAAFTAWSMHDPVPDTERDHVDAIPAARTAYIRSGGHTGVWGHLQADPAEADDWPDVPPGRANVKAAPPRTDRKPTLPGAAFPAADAPYGPGSAYAAWDGTGPDGFTVKGNGSSMIYHEAGSPSFAETKAEVWFRTPELAEAAGFRRRHTA